MVLELVRPWRFPIRELPFEQKKHQEQQQQQGGKVAKKSSFSMGFRSYIWEFFGAVLELVRPSEARCFPSGRYFFEAPRQVIFSKLFYCSSRRQQKLSKKVVFLRFQKTETIRQFFGVVLELVRPWRFPIRELPLEQKEHQEQEQQQQQGEKVAKKSSFSMGFRSYIREFFGAVLELVRPSEARCFPPGR